MILLVNDDGIDAPGLRMLYHAIRQRVSLPVLAVAPQVQHSGQSQAITIHRALTVTPINDDDFFGFAVDGTPTDCLKLALRAICPQEPQLVVSGINAGPNVGRSIFYSGTVGAALEAAVEGLPALAISRDRDDTTYLEAASEYAAKAVRTCCAKWRLPGQVLNLNLPGTDPAEWGELQAVPHGLSGFDETYTPQRQQDGSVSWQLTGTRVEKDNEGLTDAHVLKAGAPSLTLLRPDCNVPADSIPGPLLRRLTQLAAG